MECECVPLTTATAVVPKILHPPVTYVKRLVKSDRKMSNIILKS